MNDKIRPIHLQRAAYIYVRQSSLHQVRCHLESHRRQYELNARARELGFSQIVVIDEDLGITGAGTQERPGFGRLLAAVCEGQAGAVLALEASRLARNNRDWHHLIDLCVLTDALVIDADGIYDPRLLNDRLLLGLKGTMSEFELSLLRQRALEAYRQKVARGEVLTQVPIGYIRTETDQVEITPDRQVQEAIHGVFAQFRRLGTARQVLLWYRQEKTPMCSFRPQAQGELQVVWELPVYSRILAILKNPMYAGAFAYGRTRTQSQMVDGRARKSGGHAVPLSEWSVLIRDHHPGYISWDEYLRNQQQLAANLSTQDRAAKGAAKGGPSLLAGLLRCARCGRKLHVCYSGADGRVPRYQCRGGNINHGVKLCISFGGLRADRAIAELVLDALQPLGVEAALRAWEMAQGHEDQKTEALKLALEKARYEADRARRQYDTVEPENRLVAAELEARWNIALGQVAEAEAKLKAVRSTTLEITEIQRQRLFRLGEDLRTLWHHVDAPSALKKRILRTVIEEIVADVDEAAGEVLFRIHWAGGVHTPLRVRKNRIGTHGRTTDREVVDLVRELASVSSDGPIAALLNRLGYETGAGNSWNGSRVRSLRDYQGIPCAGAASDRTQLTLTEVAEQLGVNASVVRTLVKRRVLPARQVVSGAPWIISRPDLQLPDVQRYLATVHQGRSALRQDAAQSVMPLL